MLFIPTNATNPIFISIPNNSTEQNNIRVFTDTLPLGQRQPHHLQKRSLARSDPTRRLRHRSLGVNVFVFVCLPAFQRKNYAVSSVSVRLVKMQLCNGMNVNQCDIKHGKGTMKMNAEVPRAWPSQSPQPQICTRPDTIPLALPPTPFHIQGRICFASWELI